MVNSQRKKWWIALLFVILAALIALIVQLGRSDKARESLRVLLSADLADTVEIVTSTELVTLTKTQTGWHLTHPVDKPANEARVTPLLSLLILPQTQPYSIADVDPQELGLAPPLASVKINGIEFGFGRSAPGEHKRYLSVNDSVYLVDDLIFPLISGGVSAFSAEPAVNKPVTAPGSGS